MRIFQKPCWKTAKTNVSIGIFFRRPEAGNFPVIVGKWTSENIQRTQKSSAELSAAKAGVKADVWPTEILNQFVQKTGLLAVISGRDCNLYTCTVRTLRVVADGILHVSDQVRGYNWMGLVWLP